MPRSFAMSFASSASVDRVFAAFADREYWLARLAALAGGARTLDSLAVEPGGSVRVVSTEDLRHGALPGLLASVYRGDLNIVTTEVWAPAGDGRVHGRVEVAVTGAPGSGGGTAVLSPAAAGSLLDMSATVRFNVPLVGGRIENYLVGVLREGFAALHRFTDSWLREHG